MKNKKMVILILCILFPIFYFPNVVGEEPENNFYAISKSNNPTQWILQGNETLEEEIFHDDISNVNWDLYGASERYFLKSEEYASNYLLNNYSIGSGYEWMYTGDKYKLDIPYSKWNLCWDGSNWYIVRSLYGYGAGTSIYKYTESWDKIYCDPFFQIHPYTLSPNENGIALEWNGVNYFVLFEYGKVKEYDTISEDWPASLETYNLPSGPWPGIDYYDIAWDGVFWWALGSSGGEYIYKFYSNWTYTGDSILLEEGGVGDFSMIEWDGTNWWNGDGSYLYKFDYDWEYTGIRFNVAPKSIVKKDSYFYIMYWSTSNDYIYRYFSEDSIGYNISKFYQGNGHMYMQTNKLEEVGLISSIYNSNCSLSSGDYFKIDFETNSNSEVKLELINDGLKVKELVLNSGKIFLDEDVEFDQIRFISLFEDQDYLKINDIRCYNVTIIEHYAEFYVEPFQSHSIYLTPTIYNLKILEGEEMKVDENIVISEYEPFYYIYYSEPIQCQLFLSSTTGSQLDIENLHIKINRSI